MSKSTRTQLLSFGLLALFLSSSAKAATLKPVACSVAVEYRLNGIPTGSYQKSFVIEPGVKFVDDFSTSTRIKTFEASSSLAANGNTLVNMNYSDDVGVFDSVEVDTTLSLKDREAGTATGSNGFFTSRPTSAGHITVYTLTCRRGK